MAFQTGLFVFSGGGPHLTPLDGVDGDGNPILYGISGHPAKGAASIGTADGGLFHPDDIGTTLPILMFDPGNDFDNLLEGETEGVSIVLAVVGGGDITITLTVMGGTDPNPPENQPPQFLTSFIQATVDADGTAAIDLSVHCVDVEGDPITYAIITQPGTGAATLNGSTVTYSGGKPLAEGATTSFLVKATSNNEIATATIIITGINDPPVFLVPTIGFALPINVVGIYEASLDLSAFVKDPDEGDTLTYAIVSPPANGIASITGWVLSYLGTGDTFGVSVTDSHGETATATVVVTIDRGDGEDPGIEPPPPVEDPDPNVNNPPEWLVDPIKFILSPGAGALAIFLSIYTRDLDGDAVVYGLVSPPNVGTASIQGSILTYLGGEPLAQGETTSLVVSATDPFGKSATATIIITGANDPPRFLTGHPIQATVDGEGTASIDLSAYVEDPDNGEVLTYGVVSRPGVGTVRIAGAILNYSGGKPLAQGETTYATVGVMDSHGLTDTATIIITGINDPPEWLVDPITISIPVNIAGRYPSSIDLSEFAEDPDNGDTLTYGIVTFPTNGTASITGWVLTYLGDEDTFEVSVTDSHGETATTTVVVTIEQSEDPGGEDPGGGGEDPGGEDPGGGGEIPTLPGIETPITIASPALYPREITGTTGEYEAVFSVVPDTTLDRLSVSWRAYEAPVTAPNYAGQRGGPVDIEPGSLFGKANFNASGIAGLQTSVVFEITKAQNETEKESMLFSRNQALAWMNPVPGTTPPVAVVFAPQGEPLTFEKFQSDPIVFSVGAANGGESNITVTYKIEHQPVVDRSKARGYSTTGSLTFPPGESTQTVNFSPLVSIQQKWNSQVSFQLTGAGGKPYWPVPLIVPIVEPTEE